MIYVSLALYLLDSLMVLTFMEPEEGHEKDLKMLAMFWPFLTILAIVHDILGTDNKE
jgi:hypothetical protein